MFDVASWFPLVSRTLVVGVFGGAGLVLMQIYSRRGPLIYPVYAAILASIALVSARFRDLPYVAHLAAALTGMFVATAMALVAVLVLGARERERIRESGRPMGRGGAPWWGFPLILLTIVAASALVAYVSS
jgi:hypothetical protein